MHLCLEQSETTSRSKRFGLMLRCTLVCLLLILLGMGHFAFAEDPERSYFDGLRQRHLFGIAEGYCLERLAEPRITDQERARYSLELARTLAAHAMVATGNEQTELWNRAENMLAQFIKDHPRWADITVFQAERARIAALQAEILYWQVKALPHDEQLKQSALTKLTEADKELILAETLLNQLLKKAGANRSPTVLKTATVRDMLLDFQLLLAQTKIRLADLSDPGSPQRAASLAEAEKWLEPLSRRATTLPLTWHSKLALVKCDRIAGDTAAANRAIQALIKEQPPAYLNEGLFLESMRILLAENKSQEAATRIIENRQQQENLSSELGYLEIESLIRLRKIALENEQTGLADELWKQTETRARFLEASQPGYWSQRARMLIAQQQQVDQYGTGISQSLKQAQLLYSQGKIEQAIEAYNQTAKQAIEAGKFELAFELGFTSASLHLKAKQYKQAAEQFQSLSQKYNANPRAADAALLAAWCLGQIYSQSRTKSKRLAYTTALEAVRTQFPNTKSEDEATWMLARLQEARLQYSKALVLYSEISPEHSRAADAHLGIARCYEQILSRLTSLNKPTDAWRVEAIDVLEKFLNGFPDRSTGAELIAQAEIAVRLTRIYLNNSPPQYQKANRLLELIHLTASRMIAQLSRNNALSETSVSEKTKQIQQWNRISNQALRLQIIALAGQGNPSAAQSLVESLETAGTDELLSVLNGISQIELDLTPQARRELGQLQLKSAEKLASRREQLNQQQLNQLDLCLAEAYLAIDQPMRALEYYQELLKASPKDRSLLRQVALLLLRCGTKACLREATQKWRQLEAAEKAGTPPWLEARLHVIQSLHDSGDVAEAKKLLGVTKLLYPELGNAELKQQYQELQSRMK